MTKAAIFWWGLVATFAICFTLSAVFGNIGLWAIPIGMLMGVIFSIIRRRRYPR